MRSEQAVRFSNISADTSAFELGGGLYQFAVVATWGGGTVSLKQLGPDGSTYLSLADVTANGGQQLYLPPGQYKVTVTTATAVYATVVRLPVE